jgi:hypothetical protein
VRERKFFNIEDAVRAGTSQRLSSGFGVIWKIRWPALDAKTHLRAGMSKRLRTPPVSARL